MYFEFEVKAIYLKTKYSCKKYLITWGGNSDGLLLLLLRRRIPLREVKLAICVFTNHGVVVPAATDINWAGDVI